MFILHFGIFEGEIVGTSSGVVVGFMPTGSIIIIIVQLGPNFGPKVNTKLTF